MSKELTKSDSTLLSYSESRVYIDLLKKTTMGKIFPILPEEYKQLGLICLQYFIIGFTYSFQKLFKENVIYLEMNPNTVNWLKAGNFFGTVILTNFIQKLINVHGIGLGVRKAWKYFTLFYLFMAPALLLRKYIQPDTTMAKDLFIGRTAEIRSLIIFKEFSLLLSCWVLAAFYIVSEIFGTLGVGYMFLANFNDICTEEQFHRYLRPVLASASAGTFIAGCLNYCTNKYFLNDSTFTRFYISYSAEVSLISLLYFLTYVISCLIEIAFETPVYGLNNTRNHRHKKKTKRLTFFDGLLTAFASKTLLAMCTIVFCFNVAGYIYSMVIKTSYVACANFLTLNPTQKPSPNFPTTPQSVGSFYDSIEFICLGILSFSILLVPYIQTLFDTYGVRTFGCISILIIALGTINSLFFAIWNFPEGNNGKPVIFGLTFSNSHRQLFVWEARTAAFYSMAIKLSKFAFFDIIKEAISIKIDPLYRTTFKGIIESVCGRCGRCAGSGYCFLITFITGSGDLRYSLPISACFIFLILGIWSLSICFLHFEYKESVEKKAFINLKFRNKNDEKEVNIL